ncbi:MAG TPA: hypothetical protein VGL75_04205 [Acidothermaceae bacterium]|jgi:hypothetical protein
MKKMQMVPPPPFTVGGFHGNGAPQCGPDGEGLGLGVTGPTVGPTVGVGVGVGVGVAVWVACGGPAGPIFGGAE